jgi:magnesium and cobalt transporter
MIQIKKDSFIKKLARFLFYSSDQNNLRESIQDAIEESPKNDAGSNLTSKEKTILENILTINNLKPRHYDTKSRHNLRFS